MPHWITGLVWVAFAIVQAAAQNHLIITGSNVRLRSEPQTTASEVARFALGTIVTELEKSPDGQWRRVAAPDGLTGWVFANFVARFDEKNAAESYRSLAQARLKLTTSSFNERLELVRFLDRVVSEIRGPALVEFKFLRLTALNESVKDIRRYEPQDPSQREWVMQHETELAFSEPAGQWILQSELFWKLEAEYHDQPIAEAIAWAGARNSFPGECEGYIPCDLTILLMSEGRYLDLYPAGPHMDEALDAIDFLLNETLKPDSPYTAETADRDQLQKQGAELTAILGKIASPRKTQIIERLRAMVQRYSK